VPRRRTFASAFHGRRSLDAACALPSMAPLAGNAGSRSTGDPSLAAPSVAHRASFNRVGEAGIGERLRSDEVLRETTKLLPAPPTNRPQAGHPQFWLKRGFGVARAPSPDVRYGHPCPPLSPRRRRLRPPGCAYRRGRLTEHGRPLAAAASGVRFIVMGRKPCSRLQPGFNRFRLKKSERIRPQSSAITRPTWSTR